MFIIYILIGLIVGAIAAYLIIRPKLKTTQVADQETANKNQELLNKNKELSKELNQRQEELTSLNEQIYILDDKKIRYTEELQNQIDQSKEIAKAIYDQDLKLAKDQLEKDKEQLKKDYQQASQEFSEAYLESLNDSAKYFTTTITSKKETLDALEEQIAQYNKDMSAMVEANKRAEEISQQSNFYRLNLSDEDIEEIKKLRSIIPYLRNPEALNKVIWKTYYEKPYSDLVGRVIGTGVHTGIYKITNLENGMCYVGQSVNLIERWRQHIKRGIGAETPTRNKLYPAMLAIGVENFTFEVIEECSKDQLDEREDYWQNYFHSNEFGYSIK